MNNPSSQTIILFIIILNLSKVFSYPLAIENYELEKKYSPPILNMTELPLEYKMTSQCFYHRTGDIPYGKVWLNLRTMDMNIVNIPFVDFHMELRSSAELWRKDCVEWRVIPQWPFYEVLRFVDNSKITIHDKSYDKLLMNIVFNVVVLDPLNEPNDKTFAYYHPQTPLFDDIYPVTCTREEIGYPLIDRTDFQMLTIWDDTVSDNFASLFKLLGVDMDAKKVRDNTCVIIKAIVDAVLPDDNAFNLEFLQHISLEDMINAYQQRS